MADGRVLSPGGTGRQVMRKICFIGPYNQHRTLIKTMKDNYQLVVLQSDDGREFIKDPDVVFFVDDFEGEAFRKLFKLADAEHQPLVVGEPYIYSRVNLHQELYAPKPRRPIFCSIMSSVVVILGSDIKDKKYYVNLIHYMGGRVKKEDQTSLVGRPQSPTKQQTTVYITRKAGGSAQRTAGLLKIFIVQPNWVTYCWERRCRADIDVISEGILQRFALGVFEGLAMFFVGFMDSEVVDMSKSVRENKGAVVEECSRATHVVCNPNAAKSCEDLELNEKSFAVTDQWLWTSVSCSRCLNEEDYSLSQYPRLCRGLFSPNKTRTKSMASIDFEGSKNSHSGGSEDYSTDDLEALSSPIMKTPKTPATPKTPKSPRALETKTQQVTIELLETERSYLHALDLAMRFREQIEKEYIAKEGEYPISKADLAVIFGKLPPIIKIHTVILEQVQAHVDSWNTERAFDFPRSASKDQAAPPEVADIWINAKRALIEAYPPYINTYENGKAAFEAADQKSTKFHAFIRATESNPDFKRNKLMDLLIRPVQRLPSVTLLLKELQKRVEGEKKGCNKSRVKRLSEANAAIHDVLTHANQVRFVTDANIAHLSRFTDMDQVPPHLVCSRRQFIAEMDAVSICGTGDWLEWQKTDVRVILFNDVVVICKIRDQGSNGHNGTTDAAGHTMSRLQRQTSLSTLRRKEKKPLKYIKHIPNQFIREIRELREDSDTGPPLYTVYSDSLPIMVIVVRENSYADNVWMIQPKDKGTMDKVLTFIHQQLMMEYNRNIRSVPYYPLSELLAIDEIDEPLRKYLKRLQQSAHNATFNFPTMPRNNMFRRAISSASLSVANRLSRMTSSRSNLRDIIETPPSTLMAANQTVALRNASTRTPDYNPNPRHSTHSSPELLDELSQTFATPKRGLRARISSATFNLNKTLFRRNSIRQPHQPMSPIFSEENKENSLREHSQLEQQQQ